MTGNTKCLTLFDLITQQVREIIQANPTDDPALVARLTTVTEQLHGAQVLLQLAGMNRLTNPVPDTDRLEAHVSRLPPKQDKAEPPPFVYPALDSPEWKQVADMLRIVKGGKEAETHEIKAAIRGIYPIYQCGDKFRLNGQLTTCIEVRMPLELNEWIYTPANDSARAGRVGSAFERIANDTPVKAS